MQATSELIEAGIKHLVAERAGKLTSLKGKLQDRAFGITDREGKEAILGVAEQDEGHL